MRKSERNLLACIDANIYDKLFELLNDIDDVVADLVVDLLTVLTSLTITVSQLKLLLRYLKTENNIWVTSFFFFQFLFLILIQILI